MRAGIRSAAWRTAAALLVTAGLSGCANSVAGLGGTDSSTAFSAFSRPQQIDDAVPPTLWSPLEATPTDPDVHTDRKVAVSSDLTVYLVHAAPDVLCLVLQEGPGENTGGQGCTPGPYVIANGMMTTWGGSSDPENFRTAVLIPDGYTATITKGTFVLAGQGVLVVQGDAIAVTLTNNTGHALHLTSPAR